MEADSGHRKTRFFAESLLLNPASLAMVMFSRVWTRQAVRPGALRPAGWGATCVSAAAPPGPAGSLVRLRHLVARGRRTPARPPARALYRRSRCPRGRQPRGVVRTAATGHWDHLSWSFRCGESAQGDDASLYRRGEVTRGGPAPRVLLA